MTKRTDSQLEDESPDRDGVRLQKVLAAAGVASRRGAEVLISAGRVQVDGRTITELGTRVDPLTAVVKVDGRRVVAPSEHTYLMLNKPVGVLSTLSDPEGRPTVAEFVTEYDARVFHVGRLDVDTEGLLLLTDDGALAHRLAHPSSEVPKTYLAEVTGPVPRDLGRQLRSGIVLDDGPARVDGFKVVDQSGRRVLVEIVVHEGRNRIVRRIMDASGFPVRRLVRTKIGPVALGRLHIGHVRRLSPHEVASLYDAVGM